MFKEWLNHLGGGEYAAKFIEAGYDLPFIAKHGVTAEDLDCVGIPSSKMGLRRKISTLHELSQFYEADADEEEEEEDEDDGEEEEEEEDDAWRDDSFCIGCSILSIALACAYSKKVLC